MKMSMLIEAGNGFVFAAVAFVISLLLIFLNGLRRGLIGGKTTGFVGFLFWLLLAVQIILGILVCPSLLFNGYIIPLLICVAVYIIGIVILVNKRTGKAVEAANSARIKRSPLTKELISAIIEEGPEKVVIYNDGIVFQDAAVPVGFDRNTVTYSVELGRKETVQARALTVPAAAEPGNGISRVIRFADHGYGTMDDNAKRAFAGMVVSDTKRYSSEELEISHNEKRMVYSSDSRTGHMDSYGNVSISGSNGSSEEVFTSVTDGYLFVLTRNDFVQSEAEEDVEGKPEEKKLRSW